MLGTNGAGWRVLEASSVSYGKATPFQPLAELLRGYFRIDDRDDLRTARAKVTGTLLTLDRALEDAVPAVLWILEVLEPEDAFLGLEPPQRRRRAIEASSARSCVRARCSRCCSSSRTSTGSTRRRRPSSTAWPRA